MKLMLIDGNSIVNRAFYGIRMLNAPDGTPTNGIYGFITILQRLLDEEKPDSLCVTFDVHAPTFRHLDYDGYKAQRKGMPDELRVQMPILKEVLDAMGIMRIEKEGFEADDLIGTLAGKCEREGGECVIVTGDKDSFQLITDKITVKHVKTRMGQTETVNYTPARFAEEYGFEPIKMIDLKALMGDTSDNIPGVAGIGEKTALDLVQRFESLDNIYENIDTIDVKDGVRKKLREGEEMARKSFWLATIVTDAPVETELADTKWCFEPKSALYDIFLRLGFTKFIEKYKLTPSETSAPVREFEGECTSVIMHTMDDVRRAAEVLRGKTACVYCDDGITSVNVDEGNNSTAYILCEDDFSGNADEAFAMLLAPEVKKIGHNTKDIIRRLVSLGQSAEAWKFDTALAAYLLDSTAGSYDIPRLCVKYCGFEPYRAEGASAQTSLFDEGTSAEKIGEAASMAAAIACLREVLDEKMREMGCDKLYYEVENPLCAVLADMEHAGFLVDRKALLEYGESMTDTIEALQRSIWDLAGEEFNINSPKQLGVVLFEKLMLPAGKKTKTGWSTNADILEKLRDKHPIINEILDYRTLTKLKSTYADGLLKVIGEDGRIHTSFMMTVTDTGRLSSREPNLQNIPVRKEFGAQIRKMFVAPDGKVLVDADYSQIELRLLAHISEDETMRGAFISGEDVHAVTASQVFGVPLGEVTPRQRSSAKAVNFGIVYGISAWSLAQDIGVFPAEAKAYMDAYLEKYSGVREYQKNVVEKAKADGYVVTEYGRRRYLPELKASNFAVRSFGERVALNMPIQGTAADVMKIAMVNVHRRLREEGLQSRLILQVHDELIAECPEHEAEKVCTVISEEMERAASFSVPLVAEAKTGRTWAEAH
ncbi:MAG: DNA polymerase I [Oscillospiraceae bacterium]|nr:DNA polymerase I [Oscillospiraceae bacterium]